MRLIAYLLAPLAYIGRALDERHRRTERDRLALAAAVAECQHSHRGAP